MARQTVQVQIKLLYGEVWSGSSQFALLTNTGVDKQCYSLFAILVIILWTPAVKKKNILYKNRTKKVFEILEHLLYKYIILALSMIMIYLAAQSTINPLPTG